MLPLLHGPLPPPEWELQRQQQDSDVAHQLARRFARVVTLRHRQRHSERTAHQRRHHPQSQVEAEPEPEDANLDASIRSLQAHIASLERSTLLRDSATLLWRTSSSVVALDLTRECFLQFMHGYDSVGGAALDRFIASVFRPDILCRDFQGIQAFKDQWKKYTIFHQGVTLELHTVRLLDSEDDSRCAVAVYAKGEINLTFTQDTLKFLYPALFTQSLRNSQEREIVNTLVGSRGCMPMELVFNFDQQGRVFAFESRVNLVSTLLKVLHSPSAAILAHQSSIMTTDGRPLAGGDRYRGGCTATTDDAQAVALTTLLLQTTDG